MRKHTFVLSHVFNILCRPAPRLSPQKVAYFLAALKVRTTLETSDIGVCFLLALQARSTLPTSISTHVFHRLCRLAPHLPLQHWRVFPACLAGSLYAFYLSNWRVLPACCAGSDHAFHTINRRVPF